MGGPRGGDRRGGEWQERSMCRCVGEMDLAGTWNRGRGIQRKRAASVNIRQRRVAWVA